MNRDEFIKRLHPAITHINASDSMSEETLNAINSMVEMVINMSPDELKRLSDSDSHKSGIELIAEERREQIVKHGYTVYEDEQTNPDGQLSIAAQKLCPPELDVQDYFPPYGWDEEIWDKMSMKPYLKRLIIAGALIAAEIDRIQAQSSNSD